jgi:GAF domain-containing protein
MSRVKKPARKKVRAKPPAPKRPAKKPGSTGSAKRVGSRRSAKKVGSTGSAKKADSTTVSFKKRLAEALEQQAATSEILRVISSSPADAQPVFEAIAANALRLCDATFSSVFRFDGELIHLAAHHHLNPAGAAAFRSTYPSRPSRGGATQRAILTGKIAHIADVLKDPDYAYHDAAKAAEYRSALSVPMLHDGRAIGTITVYRKVPKPFPDTQIELLKTFAAQAVIAVENVRLFKEVATRNRDLTEALEQQIATSDILRVISQSPTDVQPVFDTIAKSALELCRAGAANVFTYDGELVHLAAFVNVDAAYIEELRKFYPRALSRDTAVLRAIQARSVTVIPDVLEDPEYVPVIGARATAGRFRSILAVPLMREGKAIGAIAVGRAASGPFPDAQIALLKTFADQAVIAIENVRLFKELENRNRDLTEALEQQTATSEILRVISRSPTDVQPVFDTIAAAALKLCSATSAVVTTFDGELIRVGGLANVSPEGADAVRARYPRPPGRYNAASRAVLTRSLVVIPDVLEDPEYEIKVSLITAGFRSVAAVPLLRDGHPLGAITVVRPEPGTFPEKQIALLSTFADQAVIAIENVRLFTELDNRNRDLTEALEQQTSTSEILRVISQSPTDAQPVFDTIAAAALKLCGASSANVFTIDGELIRLAALVTSNPEADEAVRRAYPRPLGRRDTAASRAVLTCNVAEIPDVLEDQVFGLRDTALSAGFRSILAVPLMREGSPIGAIAVGRPQPGPFPDKQIALLQTFADQAVIAIENVRLFTELENRNRDLSEALEQQTATSEILRVISQSPTDVQPVFDTIAGAALTLCKASTATVFTFDGELIRLAAIASRYPEGADALREAFPRAPGRDSAATRAVQTRSMIVIPDVLEEPDYAIGATAAATGFRSVVSIPLLREGNPIGVLGVGRFEPGPFPDKQIDLLKTFADQALIAIENVRLFNETKEALERQTATAEILKVISGSPTDVQPVFEAIAERAAALCEAEFGFVTRYDGNVIHHGASVGPSPEALALHRAGYPMKPGTSSVTARVVLQGVPVQIEDMLTDPEYEQKIAAKRGGFRSGMGVPMLREGKVIGAIVVVRTAPGKFSERHVGLLQTFADQAVIAIENVRLFNETKEALERQTATAEILKVISESPTDVQPVFDAIAERARTLCSAYTGAVTQFDGELVHLRAFHGVSREAEEEMHALYPMKLGRGAGSTRAIVERKPVQIPDILEDPDYSLKSAARSAGFRNLLAVPMLREGEVIGSIVVSRTQPGVFAEKLVALLQMFADQAVIAIENVRLFKELENRNRDLTEALEQQTATSDILRVISQSQTDVQPVFDTIAGAAQNLCNASAGLVFTFDGKLIHLAAIANVDPAGADVWRNAFPRPPGRDTASTRAVLTRSIVAIPDVLEDPDYVIGPGAASTGFRSALAVPLMREGNPIGVVGVGRTEPGPFPDKQIALLKTFADQAIIAIENARLFKELEARTTDLTRSVGELKALGDVGQAVSSTLDLPTVLRTIVSRAVELAGMDGGSIYEYDETREQFHLHATHKLPDEVVEVLRAAPIPKGEGAIGRLAVTGEPVHIADIVDERSYQSRVRKILIRLGYRSLLAVPLLREDHLLGGLVVNRKSAGEFAPEIIELLKTFATQSALAIQNARLFREIEDKSRQLEIASQHKSEFLANMSHELRTPLNAIIGFSEVLNEKMFGEINDKQAEYLSDILESGRHLLSLINDILDLSKIEAGRMELEPSEFDLPSAIENTLILVRERAQRRAITLRRTVDERVGTIRADERKVKQVLLNLLSNALKFTPEGGQIDVIACVQNGVAEISVKDTGVGIAAEDQEAVFEEFRQVGMVSKKVEGTGLGLAISRKFIELHGGKIWVKSEPGAGATFTFTLPLTADQRIEMRKET